MNKDTILKKELKNFNINVDDIESNEDIFGALEEAVVKMRNEYLINRLEVVLNSNLIEVKDKITTCRTIFGCRISYDNLPKNISFIIREDNKPTYEQLEQQVKKQKEVIDKTIKLINHYLKNTDESGSYVETNTGWKLIPEILKELLDILKEVSE